MENRLWRLKKSSIRKKMSLRKTILGGVVALLLLILVADFTPRFHKRILEAQKLLQEQRYNESIAIYQSILEANPEKELKVKIYYQLGEVYSINMGNNRKAVEYYKKVKETTDDPLWLVKSEEKLGDISFTYLKDFTQAVSSYQRLSNFEPRLNEQDFYQYRWALSLSKMKKYDEAIEKFKQILNSKGHEHQVDSLFQMGMIHFEKKEWRQAISFWNQYVQREDRKDYVVEAKFLMANAYETLEALKKAYNIYYSILGEYPNTEVIQSRLNAIYQRRIARKR
ncbi:MAG: tetratricopeptide repeat protein [Deltaproteobacteria bacterium]|nr:MAG: tetratricopeptide repeat protein [Deltaproteobacteria bacterium]TNF30682.1 MAG: tetratricopeptide repeat protein [Deltaproteobacteria bacterium]